MSSARTNELDASALLAPGGACNAVSLRHVLVVESPRYRDSQQQKRAPMRLPVLVSLLLVTFAAHAEPSIKAPPTAKVGTILELEATGTENRHDFVTVVKK